MTGQNTEHMPTEPAPALTADDADQVAALCVEIPALLAELDTTITRTDNIGPERLGTSGHTERAAPFHQGASDARVHLEAVLRRHALLIAGYCGDPTPHGPAEHAAYLIARIDRMVGLDGTRVVYTELDDAAAQGWQIVDRRPQRVFLGRCACGKADLQAVRDARTVRCVFCGARHDTAAVKSHMLDKARQRVGTPAQLAAILPEFAGREVKAATIRQWASRGKIKGRTIGGTVVYRIGDVLDQMTARAATA